DNLPFLRKCLNAPESLSVNELNAAIIALFYRLFGMFCYIVFA
ncbi:hypothetical protein HMPREF1582_01354, partial [Gardnerella vaginalis JCP8151A]